MSQTINKMDDKKKLNDASNALLASVFEPTKSTKEDLANRGMKDLIEVVDNPDATARELGISLSIFNDYLRQGGSSAAGFAQKAINKYKESKGPEHEFTPEFKKVVSLLKDANSAHK